MKHKLLKPLKISSLLIVAFLTIFSCKKDDNNAEEEMEEMMEDEEENLYKTSGYVISSQSTTSEGSTIFTGYSAEKPTGNVDFSAFSSADRFTINDVSGSFLYGRPFDNGAAMAKFAVSEETGLVEEIATIPTSGTSANTTIINDELGFYTVTGENTLYLFNPENMEVIRNIELTGAISPTIDNFTHYISSAYRVQDNKVFLFAHINDPATGPFYDANTIYAEVVNLNTFSWESTAILENAQYPFNRGLNSTNLVDEEGNIFVTCQGSYSLDGQAGPTAAMGSRPQIVKIPVGSTSFDENYRFNPVNALGFQSLIAQFFSGFVYDANGIGYAAISAKADSDRVLELVTKLALSTISTEELAELQNLVLNSATSKWARIDLNTQTVSLIEGLPFVAGFGFAFSNKIDDKIIFQTVNIEEGENGYYEYDPVTGLSTNIYNVSGGGLGGSIYKLEE